MPQSPGSSGSSDDPLVRELLGLLNANASSTLPDTTLELLLSFLMSVGGRQDCQNLLVCLIQTYLTFFYQTVLIELVLPEAAFLIRKAVMLHNLKGLVKGHITEDRKRIKAQHPAGIEPMTSLFQGVRSSVVLQLPNVPSLASIACV